MTQDGHDRVKLGPFLGQLFPHRVAEAMGGDGRFPLRIHQADLSARCLQGPLKEVFDGEGFPMPDKEATRFASREPVREATLHGQLFPQRLDFLSGTMRSRFVLPAGIWSLAVPSG